MKARIARGNVSSMQKEMEKVAMQEVLAIYRMSLAIALNKKYHFGNGRLKEVFDETDNVLKSFDSYAGDISKAKGRLFEMYIKRFPKSPAISGLIAAQILENNIVCGNFIKEYTDEIEKKRAKKEAAKRSKK